MTKIVGYGLTTEGEADRWMEDTLREFERLCDETVILGNNASKAEKDLVDEYGFYWVEDDREWGKYQPQIKQDLVEDELSQLNPDWVLTLDMDEVFDPEMTREDLEKTAQVNSYKFQVINLYDDGYSPDLSFEDVFLWEWKPEFGFEWSQKPVHCGRGPKWAYWYSNFAPHFVLHKGLRDEKDRKQKQDRYDKYDPNGEYLPESWYNNLNRQSAKELDLDTIRTEIKETINNIDANHIDKTMPQDEKVYYKMRSPEGEVFNIKERNAERQHERYGFEYVSEEPIVVTQEGETSSRVTVDNTEETDYEDMEYNELQRKVSNHEELDINPVGKSTEDLIKALENVPG